MRSQWALSWYNEPDGQIQARHDELHGQTWSYAVDLPHPEKKSRDCGTP